MTDLYGKSPPAEQPWYRNPLAFFGLTFLAVFLAGYLAIVAGGYTMYRIAGPALERKLGELRRGG